jgi:hypothetical protein
MIIGTLSTGGDDLDIVGNSEMKPISIGAI